VASKLRIIGMSFVAGIGGFEPAIAGSQRDRVLAKCQQCHGENLQMAHLSVASRDSYSRAVIMALPSFPATRPAAFSISALPPGAAGHADGAVPKLTPKKSPP